MFGHLRPGWKSHLLTSALIALLAAPAFAQERRGENDQREVERLRRELEEMRETMRKMARQLEETTGRLEHLQGRGEKSPDKPREDRPAKPDRDRPEKVREPDFYGKTDPPAKEGGLEDRQGELRGRRKRSEDLEQKRHAEVQEIEHLERRLDEMRHGQDQDGPEFGKLEASLQRHYQRLHEIEQALEQAEQGVHEAETRLDRLREDHEREIDRRGEALERERDAIIERFGEGDKRLSPIDKEMAELEKRRSRIWRKEETREEAFPKHEWESDDLREIAHLAFEEGRVDEALKHLKNYLNSRPDSKQARELLEKIHRHARDRKMENVLEDLRHLAFEKKDPKRALELAGKYLHEFPDYEPLRRLAEEIEDFANSGGRAEPKDELDEIAHLAFEEGRHDKALGRLEEYLARNPHDERARGLADKIRAHAKKGGDTVKLPAQEGWEAHNRELKAAIGKLLEAGRHEEALDKLERYIEQHPDNPFARDLISEVRRRDKESRR